MINNTIFTLAHRQHGVVHRTQLVEHDMSAKQIRGARSRGQLIPIFQDVFVVAPSPDTFEMRCHAVQLWLDGEGFLSGTTAGRLLGLARMRPSPIHYTVPNDIVRTPPRWVEVHRTSWYDAERDRSTAPSGLIVATAERTLFSLGGQLSQRQFDHAADDAWNSGVVTPLSMSEYLERHRCRGKDGVSRVEAWLERVEPADRPTQSYFERDLLDEIDLLGVPAPVPQHPLQLLNGETIHLDIAWPAIRLAIEPGHSRYHRPENDHLRDLACGEVGWEVHRLNESMRSDLGRFAKMIARIHLHRSLTLRSTRI